MWGVGKNTPSLRCPSCLGTSTAHTQEARELRNTHGSVVLLCIYLKEGNIYRNCLNTTNKRIHPALLSEVPYL